MPCSISIITVAMLIAPMYLRSITRILKGCCVPAETRVALIQRSCGYALRPTLSIDAIEETVQAIKALQLRMYRDSGQLLWRVHRDTGALSCKSAVLVACLGCGFSTYVHGRASHALSLSIMSTVTTNQSLRVQDGEYKLTVCIKLAEGVTACFMRHAFA